MKKYIILYLLLFFAFYVFALTEDSGIKIEDLNKEKVRIENEITMKIDSLKSIELIIKQIKSKDLVSQFKNDSEIIAIAKRNGKIKDGCKVTSTRIGKFHRNDTLKVLGYEKRRWLIKINNLTGYILENDIIKTDELDIFKKSAKERKKEQRQIEKEIEYEQKKLDRQLVLKKKKEEFEKNIPKDLKNTGMWIIKSFVDEFKDKTDSKYLTTKERISGKFSNSATQNSKLAVSILIQKGENDDSSPIISMFLYEYAGNNPVKVYSKESYTILVKDKNNEKTTLYASNYSDRLTLDMANSLKLHNILKLGGKVKFLIKEDKNSITNYSFEIKNSKYYLNAYYKSLGYK